MLPLMLGFGLGLALNEAMPFYENWWNSPHWWETDSCENDDEESCEVERERAGMICLEHYGDPDWFGVTGKYYSLEHCKMGLISQRCGGNKVD